ncbi:hypothetical protein BASA61_010209 [Batrachochytrium salamandrivorans]|nr:hypothetical protein BASA61_010209 [Batrachochytrium salamandrivorans]KAH9246654.1 hypothetical protein BASA81_015779 [Batrachochytrium salamandrivorans]
MNEGAFIGSSQSAGDEAPVEETVPYSARSDQTGPKQRRVSSMVWELYTNEKDAHMKIACICQHCGHQIVHRKKSERAISHLLRCSSFLKAMMLLDPINRPDWFNNAKANKRKTAGARSSAGISQSSSQTGSILQYTLPKLMKRDLTKIEEALAMHYYLTGTAFSRIEEENLLSAFRICRPDIVLPDRKKLGGALLDSCYAKVKSVVDNHIEEIKLNACLTSDAWSNIKNEPIVNYMLISDSSTFFLESVSTGEQSHDAKWIAQDMGRVIDYLADESPTSKSTANREPTWLSAASSNAMGLLKGVFRKLEKKVNTFCTALFLPGTLSKEQASRKRVGKKSMISLRTRDLALQVFGMGVLKCRVREEFFHHGVCPFQAKKLIGIREAMQFTAILIASITAIVTVNAAVVPGTSNNAEQSNVLESRSYNAPTDDTNLEKRSPQYGGGHFQQQSWGNQGWGQQWDPRFGSMGGARWSPHWMTQSRRY